MNSRHTSGSDTKSMQSLDEELIDVLTAISVITKQLAKKINASQPSKEDNYGKAVWIDKKDRQRKPQG